MSMGVPQAVTILAPNKREVRNKRRWRRWREETAALAEQFRQDAYKATLLVDVVDEQFQADREETLRRLRSSRRRFIAQYYWNLPLVALLTGLTWLFCLPIDAWDRWMTVDATRG